MFRHKKIAFANLEAYLYLLVFFVFLNNFCNILVVEMREMMRLILARMLSLGLSRPPSIQTLQTSPGRRSRSSRKNLNCKTLIVLLNYKGAVPDLNTIKLYIKVLKFILNSEHLFVNNDLVIYQQILCKCKANKQSAYK